MSVDTPHFSDPRGRDIPKDVLGFLYSVRMFLRDFPELNRLTKSEETSTRMLWWALVDVMEDFNETPPHIKLPFADIPKNILRTGIVAYILESLSLLRMRNQINYSDGGVSVQSASGAEYAQIANVYRSNFDSKVQRYKRALNINADFTDGLHSEYYFLDYWYGGW